MTNTHPPTLLRLGLTSGDHVTAHVNSEVLGAGGTQPLSEALHGPPRDNATPTGATIGRCRIERAGPTLVTVGKIEHLTQITARFGITTPIMPTRLAVLLGRKEAPVDVTQPSEPIPHSRAEPGVTDVNRDRQPQHPSPSAEPLRRAAHGRAYQPNQSRLDGDR